MRKLILVSVLSAVVASAITVFASGPGEPFSDVPENGNAYYTNSVYRMQSLGVVSGYGNGMFGPNDAVTRGQLVTMLDKYDQSLENFHDGKAASGVYELIQILCKGGLTFNFADTSAQTAYNDLCSGKL